VSKKTPFLPVIAKIGRVPSASVLKNTGKGWAEWIAILDKAGARAWDHKKTVAYLKTKHKQPFWWQQEVTIGYGIHTGKRVEGQNQKGEYSTTATKTFDCDAKKTWKLLLSPEGLKHWLRPQDAFEPKPGVVYETDIGAYGQVRTVVPGKRLRLSWQEPHWRKASFLQLMVFAKPKGKSMVAISHDSLATAEIKEPLHKRWRQALDKLALMAEGA
jgi:uncharacterized protein YndB with AHSA1/START domain